PFQYATYVSNLKLDFTGGALTSVGGGLVRMDHGLQPEPRIVQMVDAMQAELQADPKYAALFQPIGSAQVELSTAGQFTGEAVLGNFVLDIARDAVQSQMLLATASGFREPIPPGTITEEAFRTAMPYPNRLLVYTMTGAQIQALLDYSVSRAGSDFFSQVAGVRFTIANGKATDIQVLKDGANPAAGYAALAPDATYSVATSDFQGKVAGGYNEIFAPAPFRDSGITDMRDLVRAYIRAHSPVSAQLDGRIAQASAEQANPVPAELPRTAGESLPLWWLSVAALLLTLGWASVRAAQRRG
ncbi:MAG TPA: 5'-nucleotidase, partial [Roseiflexaceae bacterium]|nr:5'-nucleotidase [Roseiflexaceae bacterium]